MMSRVPGVSDNCCFWHVLQSNLAVVHSLQATKSFCLEVSPLQVLRLLQSSTLQDA